MAKAAKRPSKLKRLLRGCFKVSLYAAAGCLKLFFLLLPTLLFIALVESGKIEIPGPVLIPRHAHEDKIHELFPHTRWHHLKPCGISFDEERHFAKALQCVNEKVWKDSPIPDNREVLPIPRCFIVSVESPDIFSGMNSEFNFVPVMTPFGPGAVVGVYQPETRTVFMVENVDAPMVYRHELQHFFLHIHDPITRGGGHHQKIWKECEEPYYEPSKKSKLIGSLLADDDRAIIIGEERIQ